MTLYTLFHLLQLDRHDRFVRQMERHDAAALTAFAFHEPKNLPRIREEVLTALQPASERASTREAIIARARRMMADHQRMRPIPPPAPPPPPDDSGTTGNGAHA